jgi:DNA-binding NarL/FixJ family response regulator
MDILIAEPREILRMGIKKVFTEDTRVVHVYEAATLTEMKTRIHLHRPALTVMNQALITTVGDLPAGNFIVMAPTFHMEILKAVFKHGGRGYLSENAPAELLRTTLNLSEGCFLIEPSMVCRIMANLSGDIHSSIQDELLTPREREIVALLRAGIDRPTITKKLHIAETTLKTHITNITRKSTKEKVLGSNSRL